MADFIHGYAVIKIASHITTRAYGDMEILKDTPIKPTEFPTAECCGELFAFFLFTPTE